MLALRIARRSIRRNLGRSLLVAVLVAVPVAGATMADVIFRTITAPERDAARTMGAADAHVTVSPDDRLPDFRPGPWTGAVEPAGKPDRDPQAVDVAALLPTGSRTVRAPTRYDLTFTAGERSRRAMLLLADVREPLHQHEAKLIEGRAPTRASEIVLTPRLAERLRVEPGATVDATIRNFETDEVERLDVTVTGLAEERYCLSCEDAIAAPGSSAARAAQRAVAENLPYDGAHYLVELPPGADAEALWPGLAERGVALTPRAAFEQPEQYEGNSRSVLSVDDLRAAAMSTLIAGIGLLEVVLLAGTAFAVGARRQTRELGLVAASGGSAHHVRRIVLAQGLVLGALGAALGVAAGFALAIGGRPLWERLDGSRIDAWAFGPWEIAGAAAIGLLSGLAAALVPAIGAGRMRPVDALAERFRVKRRARRLSAAAGVALVVAGVALGLAGDVLLSDDFAAYERALATAAENGIFVSAPTPTGPVAMIVLGATLLVAGLVILAPAAIGALAGLAGRLPLSSRLAVRDAARHRHRTGPATSAIGIAVAGSVVLAFLLAGNLRAEELRHIPSLPEHMMMISPSDADTGAVDTLAASARATLPGAEPHELRRPLYAARPGDTDVASREIYLTSAPGACDNGCLSGTPAIAGGAELNALVAGRALDAEARAALDAGRVVVFQRSLYVDGNVVVEPQVDTSGRERKGAELSAHLVRRDVHYSLLPAALMTEAAARRQGWETEATTALVPYDPSATEDQIEAVRMEAERLGAFAQVEEGPQSLPGALLLIIAAVAGLVTLIGVAISVALSAAEGRADLATLAAVGAPPRRRRALAAAQALVIAGLGCAMGVGFGAFVAYTARATTGAPGFAVPWANLGVTAIAVPLLATLVAAAFVPSRLPLMRRAT
ncbi:MAG TPA: ABC transporter permease [Solirubrobacteraceae bacterium]|nr:ABC transporter permease [Solirubrobacteraceae bacterium]